MRTVATINEARWWKRPPTQTAEKLQIKMPEAKVEVAWHMVHERSNGGDAWAIKITKDGAVSYLAKP